MQSILQASDTSISIILQATLLQMQLHQQLLPSSQFKSINQVMDYEKKVVALLENVLKDFKVHGEAAFSETMKSEGRMSLLKDALGPAAWMDLIEKYPQSKVDTETLLWRYSRTIQFDHFQLCVNKFGGQFAHFFPLLNAFLNNETRLKLIPFIVRILKWHKILFENLQSNEISREEARQLRNRDILTRISDKSDRFKASKTLEKYCAAFNASFPIVQNLYECQPNPFLTPNGEVDVGGPMSADTPIIFSLPSMLHGENDAAGLCTPQLLNRLHRLHEELLALGVTQEENEEAPDGPRPVRQRSPTASEISYLSPTMVLKQKLVMYNRVKDFLPLLHIYALQPLELAKGNELSYDFAQIQTAIRNGFLAGKQSVNLRIRHYQYRGDGLNSGRISGLRRRIPQRELPQSILHHICEELDSQDRVTRFLSKLEVCMGFVADIGGEGVKGLETRTVKLRLLFI
jgi:hypothetical protein